VADYIGQHPAGNDQAKIELAVTGTKEQPKVAAYIYIQNGGTFELRPYTSPEAFDEAIYFLATNGYFKEELPNESQAALLTRLSTTVSTQVFSGMLNRFVGSSGSEFAIRSASFQYGAGAQLVLAYRNITFKYNGGMQ